MEPPLPTLLLFLVLFFFFFFLSISTGKALSEAEALLKWKSSLYQPQLLTSWSLSNSSVALCRWDGVQCDAAGKSVVELSLPNSNLNGTLDALDFSSLPNLTALNLNGNLLQGSVPASISSPAHLTRLDLGSNGFVGPIPPEIGRLSELLDLRLYNNNLAGPIPCQLSYLPKVRYFDLG
ncbi:putative LRR receptor-like serine/threonine-protein kinase [Ananas comosus]|uniref:Putative LRR receptor-like serine/threonine-protein kinase n=1 Tax=Ananas comosus TaxID=4615 RepID=A0A199VG83_ANACO|nr:putative LRR receptor-like serine/threonine-protein kinase [Ananas comosus]